MKRHRRDGHARPNGAHGGDEFPEERRVPGSEEAVAVQVTRNVRGREDDVVAHERERLARADVLRVRVGPPAVARRRRRVALGNLFHAEKGEDPHQRRPLVFIRIAAAPVDEQ